MRTFFSALAVAVAFGAASAAIAQTVPTDGEVRKIDESAGKITLKHAPIKNLDMGAMTMVFRVADPAMLKAVKVGDSVSFEADRVNGAITVTKIEKRE
ncbi:copper-binding protein [Desertibaculum subflavum]|uniref:copper-binding protein n=1 Tax=Desertibaculum subflavum TaxID=2268458 RepID=UPI000E661534